MSNKHNIAATSTTELNTHWIEVWLVNDAEYRSGADAAARNGADALRTFVQQALTNPPKGTGAWHTAREMSDADYDTVDWAEIAETLLAE